ncbi:hypothetical protein AB6A40_004141 [Gnathostoma spinigerum]|uniref:LRRCT domain-containing protein n=1 Tax=Gnathostoma spinigerum TaxID=75299 RepID=A0ABD6EL49_9BILA
MNIQPVQLLCTIVLLSYVRSDICEHCECDLHSSTVTCAGRHIVLRSVVLPSWAEALHIRDILLRHLPHFTYSDNLRVLRINHCGLTHLHPLSLLSLPNLETIHLSDNLLTQLPFECFYQLRKLRILNLARNRIRDLQLIAQLVPPTHHLEHFNLDENPLETSVIHVYLPLARQLHMSNCNIQQLNGSHITLLPSPQCKEDISCRVIPMSAQHWSVLRTLDLSLNSKMEVTPSALTHLVNVTTINLAFTELPAVFPDWLAYSSSARHVNLSGSLIAGINHHWEWCGEHLEWFDVSRMHLKAITLLSNCKVRYLRMNQNALHTVKIATNTVEYLSLSANNITDWPLPPTGISLHRLNTLILSNNQIELLPPNALRQYPQLQHLDLSENRLSNISTSAFPSIGMQLRSLNLSRNNLNTFVHPILPSLVMLDLSFNELVDLQPEALAGLPLLQHFYFSSNPNIFSRCATKCWFSALDQLTNLIDLELANCSLHVTPNLSSFQNLNRLDVSSNHLTLLDGNRLPSSLIYLDASYNRLHFISNFSTALRHLSNLKTLRLEGNPLVCDCSLNDVVFVLDNTTLNDADKYYCFSESWQYPLRAYLDNVKSCAPSTSYSSQQLINVLLFFIFALFALAVGLLLSCRGHGGRWAKFSIAYKLLSTHDTSAVVDL